MDMGLVKLEKELTLREFCRKRAGIPPLPGGKETGGKEMPYENLLATLKSSHAVSYDMYRNWERVFDLWIEKSVAYERAGASSGQSSDELALIRETADELKRSLLGIG